MYGRKYRQRASSRRGKRNPSIRKAIRQYRKSSFRKAVKKVINSETESKQAWFSSGNTLTSFNSGINSSGDILQVIPNISQGTGNAQRIGDKLTAKYCNVKGHLRIIPNDVQDSTTLPQVYVRLMLISAKFRQNYTDVTGSSSQLASGLLKKGATTTGWTGVLSDIHAPINTDLFTLHGERRFYLNQSYVGTAGPSAPSASIAVDVAKTIKFFNFNLKCKNKIIRYDANMGSSIQPVNWAPFLVVGYSYLDGSSPDTISTNLGMNYATDFRYEDA